VSLTVNIAYINYTLGICLKFDTLIVSIILLKKEDTLLSFRECIYYRDENGTYKVVAGEHHLFESEDSQVDLAVEGVFIYPGYGACKL